MADEEFYRLSSPSAAKRSPNVLINLERSSSTSRLIIPRWKQRAGAPGANLQDTTLASTTGKYASTEGRFTIIDERNKESTSMESSDSSSSFSSDNELEFNSKTTVSTNGNYEHRISWSSSSSTITKKQQQQQHQQQQQPQPQPQAQLLDLKKSKQMSGSRFRIVPLESRYKRGRWACWDFYDTEPSRKLREYHTTPHPLANRFSNSLTVKSFKSIQKTPMLSPTDNDLPLTAPPSSDHQPPVSFSFDFSDESDTENRPSPEAPGGSSRKKLQQLSSTRPIPQIRTIVDTSKNDADDQNKQQQQQQRTTTNTMEVEQSAVGGRMTPVEMLHNFGLERSLSVAYNDNRSILELLPGTIPPVGSPRVSGDEQAEGNRNARTLGGGDTVNGGSNLSGANTSIVAIDSKIEQAMDLVKTHLMFAVREEVEVMRAKIMELEATILQLEAENAILREHVPEEILSKLSLQTVSSNPATTAAG